MMKMTTERRIARRVRRDVLLRKARLERSYRPPSLLRHPDWNIDNPLELVVCYWLHTHSNFTFLQIGAFDGQANDPIWPLVVRYGLRGVVVEPQEGCFRELQARYAPFPQVTAINAAVMDKEGERDFFTTDGAFLQVASFSRSHLLKHHVPSSQIVRKKIHCKTYTQLLMESGFDSFDLVQIDAEGFDDRIIGTIDLVKKPPLVIRFEHAHLTNRACDACVELLYSHGYRFLSERRDLIALRIR